MSPATTMKRTTSDEGRREGGEGECEPGVERGPTHANRGANEREGRANRERGRVSTERGGQQERAPPYANEGGSTSEGRTSMGEGGRIMSEGSSYLLHPIFFFHFISFLIFVLTLWFSTFKPLFPCLPSKIVLIHIPCTYIYEYVNKNLRVPVVPRVSFDTA